MVVTVSPAEARNDIASLLDRVERGEEALITREGAAPPSEKVPLADLLPALRAFRESTPPWRKSCAELIREMRDDDD